ncbi:putative mitochondrial protein [Tanacetum coccineum]
MLKPRTLVELYGLCKLEDARLEFEVVFAIPTSLPPTRSHDHKSPLKEGTPSVNIRPYRHPPIQKDVIEVMLNKNTIKDKFPIPLIEELIDELHGSVIFSKLDLRSGYHQIRMWEADIEKTTFKTHEGHYEFLVMPLGLTNAPSTFESLMNEVFRYFWRKFTLVFFDDILIYSPTVEIHVEHLRFILQIMRQHKLYAKMRKCTFGVNKVEYLGHVISDQGVATDPSKVTSMKNWPQPQYSRSSRLAISQSSETTALVASNDRQEQRVSPIVAVAPIVVAPIAIAPFVVAPIAVAPVVVAPVEPSFVPLGRKIKHNQAEQKWGCEICLQERVPAQRRTWDPGITHGDILKQHLEDKVFVRRARERDDIEPRAIQVRYLLYHLYVKLAYGCPFGIGAVLKQGGHPIAYMSKALAPKHHTLSTYEKEFLARFTTPTQRKWLPKLMGYDYDIVYKKGSENIPDALSRIPNTSELLQLTCSTVSSELYARIKEGWTKESDLKALIQRLQQDGTSAKHYSWTASQLLRKGKLVVSKDAELRQALLRHFHSEGQGGDSRIQATLKRLAAYVYWKKMSKEVKMFVRNCAICQTFKPKLADFIDSQPMSKDTVIMVVVDRLSKMGHFIPLSHPITVAQAFLDKIYKLHGLPKIIVSDRDTLFLSIFWKELFHRLQVSLHMSLAYHPQTDGQNEVYLKLQPYRQHTLRKKKQHKLSQKHFGPFKVLAMIGKLAYRLELPDNAQIHPVFHVSQLKAHRGEPPLRPRTLPHGNQEGLVAVEPYAILDRKLAKRGNVAAVYVLVQWTNGTINDATWELYDDIAL